MQKNQAIIVLKINNSNKEMATETEDKKLFDYLVGRSHYNTRGVQVVKMQYENFDKVEYITLTMRMGIDSLTCQELAARGFRIWRSYNISLEDHHIIYEFIRWKSG